MKSLFGYVKKLQKIMSKYWIRVPVFGSLDIVVNAEDVEDAFNRYVENKDEYLQFHDNYLKDNLEDIQIIEIESSKKC